MPGGHRHTEASEGGEGEVRLESIARRASGGEVLERLRRHVGYDWRDYVALIAYNEDGNPFSVLAAVILSQNTSDKNSIQAYRELRRRIGVTAESIAKASLSEIEEAIRKAGLARQKARALKDAAALVLEMGGEDALLKLDPLELRERLLRVKGVGPKTVDVFLAVVRRAGVFAVDTHARRIAARWGLAREKAGYDEVSRALLEFFGPDNAEEAHRLIIALGRTYCRARNPRCRECPLRDVCPYPKARR